MKIAVGNSRMDKKWKNQDISWADLCARCGSTIRTTETVEEYRKLKKGQQDGIKDVGGFVGGHLRESRRKNGMVLCRSLLTLDINEPGETSVPTTAWRIWRFVFCWSASGRLPESLSEAERSTLR